MSTYECVFCRLSFRNEKTAFLHAQLRHEDTAYGDYLFDRIDSGDIVELVRMHNDPDPILPGTRGTILGKNKSSLGNQIFVEWWNGRTLSLLDGDTFVVVGREYEIMEVP